MSKGKERIIPILAITVILIGIVCSLYVHAQENVLEEKYSNSEQGSTITIADEKYSLDELFVSVESKTIQTDEYEQTGLALDKLITNVNIGCPSCHKYTFKAADGYQQTVSWENMQTGVLTEEPRVYFPGMAHAFWVKNVVEIEVE